METEVQRVVDEAAIRRVLEAYCRGIDRLDVELIRSAYHPGATDDHGVFTGSAWDFAAYAVEALRRHAESTMHVLGNSVVALDGDRAGAETQVVAHHRGRRDGRLVLERWGGRYVDRLERRDGRWAITDRRVVHDWSCVDLPAEEFPGSERFLQGERSAGDISYEVLAP